jgi:hypothetical protein
MRYSMEIDAAVTFNWCIEYEQGAPQRPRGDCAPEAHLLERASRNQTADQAEPMGIPSRCRIRDSNEGRSEKACRRWKVGVARRSRS